MPQWDSIQNAAMVKWTNFARRWSATRLGLLGVLPGNLQLQPRPPGPIVPAIFEEVARECDQLQQRGCDTISRFCKSIHNTMRNNSTPLSLAWPSVCQRLHWITLQNVLHWRWARSECESTRSSMSDSLRSRVCSPGAIDTTYFETAFEIPREVRLQVVGRHKMKSSNYCS